MIIIDGSQGEGGGQVLRSALALSLVTGKPFTITNIRARRKTPGLMRQHLTAVNAAAEVGQANVLGAGLQSSTVTFEPGSLKAGEYHFAVGTAGSTMLVLQTVMLPLIFADGPSRVTLEGGTHNPFAPPFDFLREAYLPLVNRMGPAVRAVLERPGFYPAGGGRVVIEIEPCNKLRGFELCERGEICSRKARAMVANLPRSIAERELQIVRRHLGWEGGCLEVQEITGAPGPGNVVTIEVACEHVTELFTGFGELRRPAEAVATHAVQQCQRYLNGSAPVGEYLTDQLILPLAVAGEGRFVSTGLSLHARTHLDLIGKFLDVRIESQAGRAGEVLVTFG